MNEKTQPESVSAVRADGMRVPAGKWRGLTLAMLATILWASYYPAARFLFGTEADKCDPYELSLIRSAISTLFFLPFVLFSASRRREAPALLKREWKTLLFLALTGIVMQGVLVFVSLKYTTAARGSLMANASPIFTVIAAWLWLKEKITPRMLTGMCMGFAGIVLVMLSKSQDAFLDPGKSTFVGDMLALLSGVCWALYTVGGSRIVKQYDTWTVTMFVFALGTLMLPFVMLAAGSPFDFRLTSRLWIGMTYMGIFTGGLAFCLWFLALKFVSASELGSFGYLSALLAALFSVLLLHERITLFFIASALLAVFGVALMVRTGKSKKVKK